MRRRRTGPAATRPPAELGWVVEASKARGGGDGTTFVCDYKRAPAGFARAVGLGDLNVAEFFTDRESAERRAFWQLGEVRFAKRIGERIELI